MGSHRRTSRIPRASLSTLRVSVTLHHFANGSNAQFAEERYEYLLKSYDVMPKGDTKAKREQLREFIGLTPLSN